MEEKIRDIYNVEKLNGNDPLVIWHNQVIDKVPEELTVADIARCIRQNLFVETAYEVLLAVLLHNPFAGDMYEGELMEKASKVDKSLIVKYSDTITQIINYARSSSMEKEWLDEEEKSEFLEYISELNELLQ